MWNDPAKVNKFVNLHINPNLADKLENEWKKEGFNFSVVTSDLQQYAYYYYFSNLFR